MTLHQENVLHPKAQLTQSLHHLLILTKIWYSFEESALPTYLSWGKKKKIGLSSFLL